MCIYLKKNTKSLNSSKKLVSDMKILNKKIPQDSATKVRKTQNI